MITVLGASGNTGGRVVERLRAEGERVRAVGRDAGRLAGAVAQGAEPCVGDARIRSSCAPRSTAPTPPTC